MKIADDLCLEFCLKTTILVSSLFFLEEKMAMIKKVWQWMWARKLWSLAGGVILVLGALI